MQHKAAACSQLFQIFIGVDDKRLVQLCHTEHMNYIQGRHIRPDAQLKCPGWLMAGVSLSLSSKVWSCLISSLISWDYVYVEHLCQLPGDFQIKPYPGPIMAVYYSILQKRKQIFQGCCRCSFTGNTLSILSFKGITLIQRKQSTVMQHL